MQHPTIPRICLRCDKDFLATAYEVKRGRALTCSPACANALRRQTAEGWKARRRQRRRTTERPKDRAREAVYRALKRGEITRKPCEVCATEPTQAHHDNYDDPLNVRWFCRIHHREIDDEIRAGLTR